MTELSGSSFGELTVLKHVLAHNTSSSFWLCRCSCGNTVEVSSAHLRSGHTKSCGHLRKISPTLRHGRSKCDRTYKTWKSMRSRCNTPSDSHYKWYGALGVKVDPRWNSFEQFLSDMGERPEGKTLDRINPFEGYSKDNCRWATQKEQMANTRKKFLETLQKEFL